jgi:hypothetical protein
MNTNSTVTNATPVTTSAGCGRAITDAEFKKQLKTITDAGFDETKLKMAKMLVDGNCLNAAQVKTVMDAFGFDESKLDFAKYAYHKVLDLANYLTVTEALDFDASKDELLDYINANKRK